MMKIAHPFPSHVVVKVLPACPEGLAVRLMFEMSEKNHFNYTVFVGSESVADVSGVELLRSFDDTRNIYIMDYNDPRLCFTGKIKGKILSHSDLKKKLEMYERFVDVYPLRADFKDKLRAALQLGQDPEKYIARIEPYYER